MSSSVCATPSSATDRRNSELLTEREESKKGGGVQKCMSEEKSKRCIKEGEGKAEFVRRQKQSTPKKKRNNKKFRVLEHRHLYQRRQRQGRVRAE
jgi:hypothetical protein